ncbi:MAG: tetratricopeptide repeat protein [Candidatus Omnitrophica bacterium]|nr:tetratricopeptide repeat protein [Candidatus Omnitrophota bacterium]
MKKVLTLVLTVVICGFIGFTASGSGPADPEKKAKLCGQADEYTKMYIETGRLDKKWALLALKKALEARKIDKESALPQISMARAYMAMGETDKAYERLKQALRLSPENEAAKKLLGDIKSEEIASRGGILGGREGLEGKKYKDGARYTGGLEDDKRSGYGIMTWADGDVYTGLWKDDRKNGHGTYAWTDGDIYTGEWKENVRTGHGKFVWSNGETYIGQFVGEKIEGHGYSVFPSGAKYVGTKKDGKRNGHGILEEKNGNRYIGQLKNNKAHGHGVFIPKEGLHYIGEYVDNKKHGHGKMVWPSGDWYVGEIKDNRRNGHGVYVWKNGNKYVGMWKNSRATGGYYYRPNGKRTWSYENDQGEWIHKKS